MFSIRRETHYAIKLLKVLERSKDNKIISLNEISKNTKISFLFLQKIARKLRLGGLIEAYQGVEGGYRLKINSKKISLKKIIEVTEGKCCLLACDNQKKSTCCSIDPDPIKPKNLIKINKKIIKILEHAKLSQI